jgi:hypothetical protein
MTTDKESQALEENHRIQIIYTGIHIKMQRLALCSVGFKVLTEVAMKSITFLDAMSAKILLAVLSNIMLTLLKFKKSFCYRTL